MQVPRVAVCIHGNLKASSMALAATLLVVAGAYQPPRAVRSRAGCRAVPTLAATVRPLIDEAPSVDEQRLILSDTVALREACSDELELVARLQLDVFLPSSPPPPAFVPVLSEMLAGNQRSVRIAHPDPHPDPTLTRP